jgi:hypothetical protein
MVIGRWGGEALDNRLVWSPLTASYRTSQIGSKRSHPGRLRGLVQARNE